MRYIFRMTHSHLGIVVTKVQLYVDKYKIMTLPSENIHCTGILYRQGCQWEVINNAELHFVISLCMRNTCASPKGPRQKLQRCWGRGICPYIVSEIISSDLDESQKSQKMQIFTVLKTGILYRGCTKSTPFNQCFYFQELLDTLQQVHKIRDRKHVVCLWNSW